MVPSPSAGTLPSEGSTPQLIVVNPKQIIPGVPYVVAKALWRPSHATKPRGKDTRHTLGAWQLQTVDECFQNQVCAMQDIEATSWGWTLYCNGNLSCQQSTYSLSVTNPPPGVSVRFDPPTHTDGQTTISYLTATKQILPGMLTLTYATTAVSGPGAGWSLGPFSNQILCNIASATCPALEIVEQVPSGSGFTTTVVSGTPPAVTQTVVGRQVNLLVRQKAGSGSGSYAAPSNTEWNIPGWTYKTYQPTGSPASRLSGDGLQGLNPVFFWTSGGDQPPSVVATLNRSDNNEIADVVAAADYNVNVPTSTATIVAHRHRIQIGTRSGISSPLLELGTDVLGSEGIDFTYSIANDAGYPGKIGMIQIISRTTTLWNQSNIATSSPVTGELDNGQPDGTPWYQPPVTTDKPYLQPDGLAVIDAPAIGLSTAYSQEAITDSFDDYFMYKPHPRTTSDTAYWVLLQRGGWSWQAGAT